MQGSSDWVIEACESSIRHPDYLVGVTAGRCFFLWSDIFKHARKFKSEPEASEWAKRNRLNCGFRIKKYEGTT